jgi:EAL domain-containing protein (putative c-di-GMP-specific phosphodiesterase class I)
LTIEPIRFLGLAFAAADLLFEVDDKGAVTFAAGASLRLTGRRDEELIGAPWRSLIAEVDRDLGEALLDGAADGERRGPTLVRLAADSDGDGAPRFAALTAFRLPDNAQRVSCALTLVDPPPGGGRFEGALPDRAAFENAARELIENAQARGAELELGLIELEGLAHQKAILSGEEAEALARRVAGALRAEAVGDVATELDEDRFAILRRRGDTPEAMARRLSRVLGAALTPKAQTFAVDPFADPGRMMRALRFALDRFIADDAATSKAASLTEVLDLSVQETVARAGTFEALVQARRFELMFQPVVSLADESVHHHEVLVRFDRDRSPFAMIRMAEELDIIESLDRAVADEAVKRLRADKTRRLRLAVNVSGRTIVSSGFLGLIERLAKGGDLADRLMFEVTESAVIDDLAVAQRHVQALQAMGFHVCLDDFGAGAASYGYLQQLSVDVVKIDGAYVRELTRSGRDDAMIRHMVSLCRELNVATVAEMVETREVADALRRAGVDYAQGWLFGQPNREPQGMGAAPPRRAARRRGSVEQWG